MHPSKTHHPKIMTTAKINMNMEVTTPWLTLGEAAARARVSTTTIATWVSLGRLKAHKTISTGTIKGITRFKVADLDALLEGVAKK